jgi:hypothetical protein
MIVSFLRRFPFLALLVLAASLGTGCVSKNRAEIFKEEVKAPTNGRKLSPDAWDKFAAQDEKRRLTSGRTSFWLLPFSLYVHDFSVARNREVATSKNVAWNDLSTPILFTTLPLRFSYREYEYTKGNLEPVSKTSVSWNLFWASASTKGEPNTVRFKAKGIPLFYAFASASDPKRDFKLSVNNVLWTLGPAWLKIDGKNGDQQQKGYFGAPLLLGGMLGGILWGDHHIQSNGNQSSLGHGPLFGFLGYWKQTAPWLVYPEAKAGEDAPKPEVKGRQCMSGALLGILWSQYTRRDEAGKIDKSRNGPLWTMFGWSHRDGKFAVKFLWIPIRF